MIDLFGAYHLHVLQTPPLLCDFEQWINTEIKESDKQHLEGLKEWDAEVKERFEQRRR